MLQASWFTWDPETEVLNNSGYIKSLCVFKSSGSQLKWKNLNLWEMMDAFEIQIHWEEIESKRPLVKLLYVVTCVWGRDITNLNGSYNVSLSLRRYLGE